MLLILNLIKSWIKSASLIVINTFSLWYLYNHYSKTSGISSNFFLVNLEYLVIYQMPNDTMTLLHY